MIFIFLSPVSFAVTFKFSNFAKIYAIAEKIFSLIASVL